MLCHSNPVRLQRSYHDTQRVFDFQHHVNQLNDFREGADIPTVYSTAMVLVR